MFYEWVNKSIYIKTAAGIEFAAAFVRSKINQ